jgi:hypothetical protein
MRFYYKANIIMDNNNKPPFSKEFVLKTTFRHMRKSVDISIRKTFDRMKDFTSDPSKKAEIFETLDVLHKTRKLLDDFQLNNKHLFSDKDDNTKGE